MSNSTLTILSAEEIDRLGASSDIRYFHTTYGEQFGYNERARKYHRSYGLVTNPANPAFIEQPTGDLATAPLYRRNHLGFRANYPNTPFTWAEGAKHLKKNQRLGEEKEGEKKVASPTSTLTKSSSPPSSNLVQNTSVPSSSKQTLSSSSSSSYLSSPPPTNLPLHKYNLPQRLDPHGFQPQPLDVVLKPWKQNNGGGGGEEEREGRW